MNPLLIYLYLNYLFYKLKNLRIVLLCLPFELHNFALERVLIFQLLPQCLINLPVCSPSLIFVFPDIFDTLNCRLNTKRITISLVFLEFLQERHLETWKLSYNLPGIKSICTDSLRPYKNLNFLLLKS